MTLRPYHIHALSAENDLFSLDFALATGFWSMLKDLSKEIHLAANPSIDLFAPLPTSLDATRLNEIGMPPPRILSIEQFTQNILLSANTSRDINTLFKMGQTVGRETLDWIGEAQRRCSLMGGMHGWHWPSNDTVQVQVPLLEGQGLIDYGSGLTDQSKIFSFCLIVWTTISYLLTSWRHGLAPSLFFLGQNSPRVRPFQPPQSSFLLSRLLSHRFPERDHR